MKRIRELEALLLRAEAAIAVVLVLVMLGLASYNVFYRNVLVPLQRKLAHSGPPVAATRPPAEAPGPKTESAGASAATPDRPSPGADGKSGAEGFAGDFGDAPDDDPDDGKAGAEGFAGDFGGDDEPEPEPAEKASAEGFAGDFGGDDEPEPEPEPEPAEKASAEGFAGDFGGADEPEPEEGPGEGEGFAGDFGGAPEAKAAAAVAADDDLSFDSEGALEDDFADLPMVSGAHDPAQVDEGPQGGPPPAGSFAAWAIVFINKIKLDWIDVFLRQLVIITSFFGAMLATQRRKHINIDALSKILTAGARRWVSAGVNVVAIGVCFILASAGWDLVKIGREYPKELLPFAEEWTFQLMFPVGFGLLALHFGVRLLEAVTGDEPPEAPAKHGAPVPDAMADDDEDVPPEDAPPEDAPPEDAPSEDDGAPASKGGKD